MSGNAVSRHRQRPTLRVGDEPTPVICTRARRRYGRALMLAPAIIRGKPSLGFQLHVREHAARPYRVSTNRNPSVLYHGRFQRVPRSLIVRRISPPPPQAFVNVRWLVRNEDHLCRARRPVLLTAPRANNVVVSQVRRRHGV